MKAEESKLGCRDPNCPECGTIGREKFIEDILKLLKKSSSLLTEDDIPKTLMVHINDCQRVQSRGITLSLALKSIESFQKQQQQLVDFYIEVMQTKFALEEKIRPNCEKFLLTDVKKQEEIAERLKMSFDLLVREIEKEKKKISDSLLFLREDFAAP